jgi:hypothetical protein
MPMDHETVVTYLNRVGVPAPAVGDAAGLRALHRAHQQTVPFENLSIHLAEPISLDERDLIDKIVHRRRGGFCYELNGAFALLLEALGARVSRVAARVSISGRTLIRTQDGTRTEQQLARTTRCWRRTGTTSASTWAGCRTTRPHGRPDVRAGPSRPMSRTGGGNPCPPVPCRPRRRGSVLCGAALAQRLADDVYSPLRAELGEDVRDMRLYGTPGQEQAPGDIRR